MQITSSILQTALIAGALLLTSAPASCDEVEASSLQEMAAYIETLSHGNESERTRALMELNQVVLQLAEHRKVDEADTTGQGNDDEVDAVDTYLESALLPTLLASLPDSNVATIDAALVLWSNVINYFDREENKLLLASYQTILEYAGREGVHPGIRSSVYSRLRRLPLLNEQTTAQLRHMIENEGDPRNAREAFNAFVVHFETSPSASEALIDLLEHDQSDTRAAAALSLQRFRLFPEAIFIRLDKLLKDPNEEVRSNTIGAIIAQAAQEGRRYSALIPTLEEVVRSSSDAVWIRREAARCLAAMSLAEKNDELIALFLDLIEDETLPSEIRSAFVGYLPHASHRDEALRPLLQRMAESTDQILQEAGERSLQLMDQER